MSKDTSFQEYIVNDLLADMSDVSSKSMFGGYAVYKHGKIFAIIAHGELYLKANDETKNFFALHNSRPFRYSKKDGKMYTMNYWFVPEEVFENQEKFEEWIDMAVGM